MFGGGGGMGPAMGGGLSGVSVLALPDRLGGANNRNVFSRSPEGCNPKRCQQGHLFSRDFPLKTLGKKSLLPLPGFWMFPAVLSISWLSQHNCGL